VRNRLWPVIVVVVLAIVVLWLVRRGPHRVPLAPAPPTPTPTAVTGPRSTAVAFTPSPEPMVKRHSTIILSWGKQPTPIPSPPREEPTARPGPSPTPEVAECLAVQYSASMLPSAPGQVLVDIRAENRCGRDLGPLDVWFWVGGYRQEDLVQSVRGHPFDPIPSGGDGKAVIALPGSIDWYDRIEVRVVQPGSP
jgi:hypothetical protein